MLFIHKSGYGSHSVAFMFLNNSKKSLPFASLRRLSERPYPETDRSDRTINHGLQMGLPVYFHLAEDRGWQNSRRAPAVHGQTAPGPWRPTPSPSTGCAQSDWPHSGRQQRQGCVGLGKNQNGYAKEKGFKVSGKKQLCFCVVLGIKPWALWMYIRCKILTVSLFNRELGEPDRWAEPVSICR